MNLSRYRRPVLVLGAGVQFCRWKALAFVQRLSMPTALTWGGIDLLPTRHPLNVGGFGTHANKAPNLAVQHADFILSVGSRLDSKSTGPIETFARNASIVMVDIDEAETGKFKDVSRIKGLNIDAAEFLETEVGVGSTTEWLAQIDAWKAEFPVSDTAPYQAVKRLSNVVAQDAVIVADTGHTLAWMMQAFEFRGQRFIHPFNMTPMGYGLSGAIGASFANPGKTVVLVTGDGGLQANIQELATIVHHKLPIVIILMNNKGHGMCRQTQTQWLGGVYPSTSVQGGLASPDLKAVANSYGIYTPQIRGESRFETAYEMCVRHAPGFWEFELPFDSKLEPQVISGHSIA